MKSHNLQPMRLFLTLVGLAWALAGCAIVAPEQVITQHAEVTLRPDQTIGQTFVARQNGLNGWQVFLAPATPATGHVLAELRADNWPAPVTATVPVTAVTAPGFHTFTIPPQIISRGSYYTLTLRLVGEGALVVGNGPENAYLDGALHLNNQPVPGQLAFMLTYDGLWGSLSFAAMLVEWLGWLVLGAMLFVLPGWWLVRTVWPAVREHSVWVQAPIGMGVGVSVMLVALVGLKGVGWPVAWALPWLSLALSVGWLIWGLRHAPRLAQRVRAWWATSDRWGAVALVVVLAVLVVTRLWPIRNLKAPLWDDSYQHTTMAQLIVNAGGLPSSWEPYYRYTTFSLHFGFSSWVAFWMWVTGHDVLRATLILGQLANLAGLLALVPLAVKLSRNTLWAGVLALIMAGLVSLLPGGYMNWGRFPQLSGQILMPLALWLSWEALEARTHSWRVVGLAGLVVAGAFFAYYRMGLYYAAFFGVVGLVLAWQNRAGPHRWAWVVRVVGIAALAGLCILPWAVNLASNPLGNAVGRAATQTRWLDWELITNEYRLWERVFDFTVLPVWWLAIPAWLWAGLRRQVHIVGLGVATLVAASIPALQLITVPGLESFAIIIFLYVPLSIIFGSGAVDFWHWLQPQATWLRWGARLALVVAVAWAAVPGVWQQITILQTRFVLVTRPDVRAMAWIRANVPAEANFLIQAFVIRGGTDSVGADAGWYIPLLAQRSNHLSPQYARWEKSTTPNYSRSQRETVMLVYQHGVRSPVTWQRLCELGMTHVYSGQGRGKVGLGFITHPEERPLFTTADFQDNPAFSLIYQADLVEIYAFDRTVCP